MKPKLVISGAAGRMGKRIIALAKDADTFNICAGIDIKDHPDTGKDIGLLAGAAAVGVSLAHDCPSDFDVMIDFSLPQAADSVVDHCLKSKAALVMGATGLSQSQHEKMKLASKQIPLIYGTNMSVGMNVLFSLAAKTASMLGDDYDIEITEQHHRFKKDAPSGSALTLAENICKATNRDFPDCLTCGRSGKDSLRQKGKIGIHSVRAGDITGIHSVIYSTLGETVTLNHSAHNRDGFARGALLAAQWLIDKTPGLYSMTDVLNIK
ncbi:MAG: 4-hydroxy-tetrahydrodipicolinate reductase [Planctomycetota bacterium]|jgi:4-hydroxy-tetrahydrodipicolinate reductase